MTTTTKEIKHKRFEIDNYLFKSKGYSIGFNFSFDKSETTFYIDFQIDFIKWWFGISIYINKKL